MTASGPLGYEGAVDALCDFDGPDAGADSIAPPTFETAAYLATRDGDQAARQEAARIARRERAPAVDVLEEPPRPLDLL